MQKRLDRSAPAAMRADPVAPVMQRMKISNQGKNVDIPDEDISSFCFYLRDTQKINGKLNTSSGRVIFLEQTAQGLDLAALYQEFKKESSEPKPPTYTAEHMDRDFTTQIPGSHLYHGTHVSFMDNIISGVNGLFDMVYLPDIPRVDIKIKMKMPGGLNFRRWLQISSSLAQTAQFWSGQYGLRQKDSERTIGIFVRIQEVDKGEHYRYNDLDGTGARPNVVRDVEYGGTFSTTTVDHDARTGGQTASFHELGHVLGLNEEYDLDVKGRTHPHEQLTSDQSTNPLHGDFSQSHVPGSIMGPAQGNVQLQHFGPIRQAFAKMTRTAASDWTLVKL
ncbi:hypothetical protein [Niveispirillum sp. KHB5.9]|uniref:hypothetical protein n=1 Tax=Niveispirillum sp. KHB5.9 TaxID=3400269 RepID=UPI003A8B2563